MNRDVIVCKKCNKKFSWYIYDDVYPGGKDREYIYCPYCNTINGSEMISGFIGTNKEE